MRRPSDDRGAPRLLYVRCVRASRAAALAGAIVAGAACGDVILDPIGAVGGGANLDGGDDAAPIDGSVARTDAPSFCTDRGLLLPGANTCVGDLANIFRFAACACSSLAVSGTLRTDSFDRGPDGGASALEVASIASNGHIATNTSASLGGSVWAGGALTSDGFAVRLRGSGTVARDVRAGGPIEIGGKYLVQKDLAANGSVVVDPDASLAVVGTITVPAGAAADGVVGTVVHGPVQVGAPCDCAHPIDVPAVVAAFAVDNDDALAGLSPSSVIDRDLTLPCGRYYVAGIAGASMKLSLTGRVALFVDGGVDVASALTIALAPEAELDLFVAGAVSIRGVLSIGDRDAPARTRVYIGGDTFALAATTNPLAANIYAPRTTLQLATSLEMWGSLFAETIQASGELVLHYDTSVLRVASSRGCAPEGRACSSCGDCGGATPACRNGACAACVTSADCCPPLACASDGRCVLSVR